MKIEWRGLENIPKGAMIVACKHQSIWETFVLPIRFPDFSYILKHELIWLPFFGWYLLAAEQIAIDRAKGGKLLPQIAVKAKKIFAQGRQLFIFPEGTRRPAGAPPQYKFGIAHLYAETETPVLPVALNSGLFWPRRSFLVRPGTVVIEFCRSLRRAWSRAPFSKRFRRGSKRRPTGSLRKRSRKIRLLRPLSLRAAQAPQAPRRRKSAARVKGRLRA